MPGAARRARCARTKPWATRAAATQICRVRWRAWVLDSSGFVHDRRLQTALGSDQCFRPRQDLATDLFIVGVDLDFKGIGPLRDAGFELLKAEWVHVEWAILQLARVKTERRVAGEMAVEDPFEHWRCQPGHFAKHDHRASIPDPALGQAHAEALDTHDVVVVRKRA